MGMRSQRESRKNETKTNFRNGKGRWPPPLTEIGLASFLMRIPCENEPLIFKQNENKRRAFFLVTRPFLFFFKIVAVFLFYQAKTMHFS